MIYSISNDEDEIEKLLLKLREKYGDYALISYMAGEYGYMARLYNGIIFQFYNIMKSNNIPCIAIIFKNNKCFVNNCTDHIVEIDDIEFASTYKIPIEYEELSSERIRKISYGILNENSYNGNDGTHPVYVQGITSKKFEILLNKLDFKNIFYSIHMDGSYFTNRFGCNGIISNACKINNILQPHQYTQKDILQLIPNINKESKQTKTNTITIFIRNTNKSPMRNIPQEFYKYLFDYCILHNKICNVFQDLIPIELPNSENIIDCTDRFKNRPNFDKFIEICSKSDIYIGANSGTSELVAYCKINIKMILIEGDHITWSPLVTKTNCVMCLFNDINKFKNILEELI
jgi:hypothetical protein